MRGPEHRLELGSGPLAGGHLVIDALRGGLPAALLCYLVITAATVFHTLVDSLHRASWQSE